MTFRTPTGLAVLFRAMLCAGVLLGAPGAVVRRTSAGDLDQVRSEVRDDDDDDGEPKQKRRRESRDDECDHDHLHGCNDEDIFEDLIGSAVLFAVTSPWWLPRLAVADDGLWATFPPAPYAQGHPGYLVIDPIDPAGTDGWSLRLSSEYATDFDDLDRIGARLIVDTSSRFGFDTEWNQWLESTQAGSDELATGDFNLVYRFAQHERIQFHSGLGMNWLADDAGSDFGVNFTWGVEAFPRDPFVVDAVIDVGSLGGRVSVSLPYECRRRLGPRRDLHRLRPPAHRRRHPAGRDGRRAVLVLRMLRICARGRGGHVVILRAGCVTRNCRSS